MIGRKNSTYQLKREILSLLTMMSKTFRWKSKYLEEISYWRTPCPLLPLCLASIYLFICFLFLLRKMENTGCLSNCSAVGRRPTCNSRHINATCRMCASSVSGRAGGAVAEATYTRRYEYVELIHYNTLN